MIALFARRLMRFPRPVIREKGFVAGALLSVMLLGANTARADEPYHFFPGTPPATQPDEFVSFVGDKQHWDFEVLGTGLADVTNRHVAIGGSSVGAGYYILDNLAIQFDVSGYGFSEGHTNGPAIGATIGLRHHVLDVGRSSLFLDVSFGELWADHNVPFRGTHLNNTFEFGPGFATPIGKDVFLVTGVRFFHLSNANNHGGDRNPSVNAVQGVVGVMWRF